MCVDRDFDCAIVVVVERRAIENRKQSVVKSRVRWLDVDRISRSAIGSLYSHYSKHYGPAPAEHCTSCKPHNVLQFYAIPFYPAIFDCCTSIRLGRVRGIIGIRLRSIVLLPRLLLLLMWCPLL